MNIPGGAVPEGGGAEPVGAAGLNGHAHYTLLALSANVSFRRRLQLIGNNFLKGCSFN